MSEAKPTATGLLRDRPLAHLLVYLYDKQLTGTLVLQTPDSGKCAITFVGGRPAKATGLDASVSEQLLRRLEQMLTLPLETVFGFYANLDLLQGHALSGEPAEPFSVIWRGLIDCERLERVSATLSRLRDVKLVLHARARPECFQPKPAEKSIIDKLGVEPQELSELCAREDESLAERVVYALLVTRQLDLGNEKLPLAASQDQTPVPSEQTFSPQVAEQRRAIIARATDSTQTLYDVLGLSPEASQAEIHSTFFALAKIWHPDRLGPEFADIREQATKAFARLTEAHQILSDEARRKEYDARLEGGRAGSEVEDERVMRALRATMSFQKAEVLLKKHKLAEAEMEARRACDDDPEQADYWALLAWIRAQSGEDNDLTAPLVMLNQAIEREPANLRARVYRGQLLKRVGQPQKAIEDFKFIIEHDPRHIEAAREVRLYEMRQSNPASRRNKQTDENANQGVGSGLFGKWFKR